MFFKFIALKIRTKQTKMERSSYFIKDKAMFGSFPTQQAVLELEENGVRYFINLTHSHEKKIIEYRTKYNKILYPIEDRHVPDSWKLFSIFIIKITNIIKNLKKKELIYIHCKGGHGRSGIVVASLLCFIFNMSSKKALEYTKKFHSYRSVMREKWRKLGSPQTYNQKLFVHKFFTNLNFPSTFNREITYGFSNSSKHKINIKNLGTFSSVDNAIKAFKKKYLKDLSNDENGNFKDKNKDSWLKNRLDIIYKIIMCKFEQHPELLEKLINTGLRSLVNISKDSEFWGIGYDGLGENNLGKILMKIREYNYLALSSDETW